MVGVGGPPPPRVIANRLKKMAARARHGTSDCSKPRLAATTPNGALSGVYERGLQWRTRSSVNHVVSLRKRKSGRGPRVVLIVGLMALFAVLSVSGRAGVLHRCLCTLRKSAHQKVRPGMPLDSAPGPSKCV